MKLTRIVLASALVVALGACTSNKDNNASPAADSTMAAPAPAMTAPDAMAPPPAATAMMPPPATTAPMSSSTSG